MAKTKSKPKREVKKPKKTVAKVAAVKKSGVVLKAVAKKKKK